MYIQTCLYCVFYTGMHEKAAYVLVTLAFLRSQPLSEIMWKHVESLRSQVTPSTPKPCRNIAVLG